MQRDFLVTFGGIMATGAFIFGCGLFMAGSIMSGGSKPPQASAETLPVHESKSGHGSAPKAESHSSGHDKKEGAGDKHGSADKQESSEKHASSDKHGSKAPAPILEDNTEEFGQFVLRYNDFVTRGSHDEARQIALKAYALSGRKDSAWLRKLGDSTFQSDTMPAQQRFSKAYEHYSALLAGTNEVATKPEDREWAQYRACLCLQHMGRWDEALEACKSYLTLFPDSARRPELRLMHAQGAFVNGDRSIAREEIEQILKDTPSADVRAKALLELAQIDSERARVEPGDAPLQGVSRAEVVVLEENSSNAASDEVLTGMPTARWQAIVAAAKAGKLDEAKELLGPLVKFGGPLNAEQRARVTLNFAKLLRELPQPPVNR